MKTIAAIVLVCIVPAGCADPPVARIITETPEVSSEASGFPWQGKFISTCHGVESLLIPHVTKVIWQGREYVVRDVAHSRQEDYCLLDVGENPSGFPLVKGRARGNRFRVLLNREGETKVVDAVLANWPEKRKPPPAEEERETEPGNKPTSHTRRGMGFPIRTSEEIVSGDSGSPVLRGGEVVGIVLATYSGDPSLVLVLPIWLVRQELDELKAELDNRACPGEEEVSVSRK